MSRTSSLALSAALVASLGLVAHAQPAGDVHKEGDYQGVEPGASTKRGLEFAKQCGRRSNLLTWIGFQPQEGGGSRVFVQLCGALEYDQQLSGSTLLVNLHGARFESRNARRALDVRFFDSALSRVVPKASRRGRGKRRAGGIQIAISFEDPADAREASATMSTAEDGYTYLFLDFGAPSKPKDDRPPTPAADAAEPADDVGP